MKSLLFIFTHTAKNQLLELRRKPGKLVMYLAIIAVMVYVVISNTALSSYELSNLSDINWVKGILIVFLMFSVVSSIIQGLAKGNAIFTMEDVNLVFIAPISPRTILMYGMFRTLKAAVLGSLFIIFQIGWLRDFFGVGFSGVLIIYAAFVLISIVTPILSVTIYSLTNGRPLRKTIVKILAVLIFLPFVIAAVWFIYRAGWDFMAGTLALLDSNVSSFTPVAGWAATGAVMLITGHYTAGFLYLGLLTLFGAILVIVIYVNNPDYYEDVLVATETLFEKKRAIAEGQINMEAISDKQIRVKSTGVGGVGASVWFFKQIREAFRASRFGFLGISTPIFVAATAVYALMQTYVFDGEGSLLSILIIMMVMQTFLISVSRGEKELYTHYIYMVPESPLKKVIWSNLEFVSKVAVQSFLIFIITGFIMGEGIALIIAAIIVNTLFAFVLVGITLIYLRYAGANIRSGILVMIYYMSIIIIMLPGLAGAIIAALLIDGGGLPLALIILTAWELIAGFICFVSSKGILHNCDILSVPQQGQ